MTTSQNKPTTREASDDGPRQIRLPGFVSEGDIGLGDVIKRATSVVGVRPCGGCRRRAEALNRRLAFTGRRTTR
jgi:hypothetical protein